MNSKGNQLLSCSKDNSNRLWDVRAARPIQRFKGFLCVCISLALNADAILFDKKYSSIMSNNLVFMSQKIILNLTLVLYIYLISSINVLVIKKIYRTSKHVEEFYSRFFWSSWWVDYGRIWRWIGLYLGYKHRNCLTKTPRTWRFFFFFFSSFV